jgi:hypothetical protein
MNSSDVTPQQLVAMLCDGDRRGDWFHAGADSFDPDLQASHLAMRNAVALVTAMMIESGFPLETFMRILRNEVVELDRTVKDRLRDEPTIGRLGAWRNHA